MIQDEEPKLLPKEPIPDFKSIEEEAEFWDTHDFTDYLDESKPVSIRVSNSFRSSAPRVDDGECIEPSGTRCRWAPLSEQP